MILRELVALASEKLRSSGISSYTRDARALSAYAIEIQPDQVILHANTDVTNSQQEVLLALINARCEGKPVARILGSRLFWGRRFEINQHVLDPRGDTETLIELALKKPAKKILDLGTGSGNLAVTLLCEWPEAEAVATDISLYALKVAARNAKSHKVSERLEFTESDWFSNISSKFDLIVSNPPYIGADEVDGLEKNVKDFDPIIALSPGKDGLSAYRQIAKNAIGHLETDGRLIVEIGNMQGADLKHILNIYGYKEIRLHKDLDGYDRVVSCKR